MEPPPGMDCAVGERNHVAMDVHLRRHRCGYLRVVGGFAGTAHARGGGGSAVQ